MRFIIIFVTAVCEFVCYFVISYDGQRKRIFSEVGGVGGGGGVGWRTRPLLSQFSRSAPVICSITSPQCTDQYKEKKNIQ